MWTVSGPFDGEVTGEVGFQKSKLLKTASNYLLGRKDDCGLVINHKKVSKSNGKFIVGSYSQEDMLDPLAVPKLELCNTKDKVMLISRGSDTLSINPSATHELQDADIITVAGGVGVTVNWIRVSCYSPVVRGKVPVSLQTCASLGISITPSSNAGNTHHLLSTFAANASIAASLISATQLVKPEWLDELIRLGTLPVNNDGSSGISLEKTFILPSVAKFRSSMPASLPHTLKTATVWEPNEERLSMFLGFRFLFVGENGREVAEDVRELVLRGQGSCEGFPFKGGRGKWHQAISKGKRLVSKMKDGKALVIVADQEAMKAAIGIAARNELVEESKSFGLHFISAEKIIHAVLYVDVSYIDCSRDNIWDDADASEPSDLQSFVPNTHPDEPSIPPSDRGMPVTQSNVSAGPTTSTSARPTSIPPPDPLDVNVPPPPRKPLARRTKGHAVIVGIDDPSTILPAIAEVSPGDTQQAPLGSQKVASFDPNAPIPARSSRLKRRAGTTAPSMSSSQPVVSPPENLIEFGGEPPLKKFKALFESSDPEKASQEVIGTSEMIQSHDESLMQSGQLRSGLTIDFSDTGGSLVSGGSSVGMKRGVQDEAVGTASGGFVRKRQAIENLNDVQHQSTADSSRAPLSENQTIRNPGAALDKPDTDQAFLKALASKKRGKKMEDNFDREFNQLKISKPDLQREHKEDEWAVLAEFGDDTNLRGNFMVIVETETRCAKSGMENYPNAEWLGRPNFKRFKRKSVKRETVKVELVATQEHDYGVGSVYWKHSKSQSQSQSQNDKLAARMQNQSRQAVRPSTQHALREVERTDNSDTQEAVPRVTKSKAVTQGQSAPAQKPSSSGHVGKVQPLFIDNDEMDDVSKPSDQNFDLEHVDAEEEDATLQTEEAPKAPRENPVAVSAKSKRRPVPVITHDDSDDEGATFKGFRERQTRSRR